MSERLFKRRQFQSEIIILCVRWYLKYPLSYRMLLEMMYERGLKLAYTTIIRWVHQYAPKSKILKQYYEQDHRFIKRKVKPMPGFYSFKTA